uniref:Uncharacterized protein n=1 Tax=Zea mays TaxID=4577 RepID=A0A804PRP8_MAIZE
PGTPWFTAWKKPQSRHASDTARAVAGDDRSTTGIPPPPSSSPAADAGRSASGFTYRAGIVAAPLSDSDCTLTTGSGHPAAAPSILDRSIDHCSLRYIFLVGMLLDTARCTC